MEPSAKPEKKARKPAPLTTSLPEDSEARYRTLVEQLPAITYIAALDDSSSTAYISPQVTDILGFSPEEWIGDPSLWLNRIHPEDKDKVLKELLESQTHDGHFASEYRILSRAGAAVWIRDEARIVRNESGEPLYLQGLMFDITSQKSAENIQRQLTRELRAISLCNEFVLRALDEQTLLSDICRIICEEIGYRMAWVGMMEYDTERLVRPVAWGGSCDDYLAHANITWADKERGQGPTGKACRIGNPVYIQDFGTDTSCRPWRDRAVGLDYHASIALPLKNELQETFGALTIYSSEPNAFTEDEIRLLNEMAKNLAFGISALRNKETRMRAENALIQSENRFRIMSENSLAGIYIIQNGKLQYVNKALGRMFGYTPEEALGLDPIQFAHPDDKQTVIDHITRRMSGETPEVRYEFRGILRSGEVRYFDAMGAVVELNGRPAIIGNMIDITDRNVAEQALRESEKRYRLVAKTLRDVIWTFDNAMKFTYITPSIKQLRGIEPEEALNESFVDTMTAESYGRCIEIMARNAEAEARGEFPPIPRVELQLKHKNGSLVWVESLTERLFDDDGRAIGYLGVTRNITDRMQAEQARIESEEKFRTAFDVNPEPCFIAEVETGIIMEVNVGFERIFEHLRHDTVGKDSLDLGIWAFEADRQKLVQGLRAYGVVTNELVTGRRKSGKIFPALISASVCEVSGKQCILGTVKDMSELKQAEERLKLLDIAVQNSGEVLFMTDTAGVFTYINPSFTELYGYSAEEVIGKATPRILKSGRMNSETYSHFWSKLVRRETVKGEYFNKSKSDTLIAIEGSANAILDSAGECVGYMAVQRDVTRRREAEDATRRSEEKYRTLFNESPDGIIITSKSRTIVDMNPAALRLLGYNGLGEVIGRSVQDFYWDSKDQTSSFREVLEKGFARDMELRLRSTAGKMLTVLADVSLIRDPNGELVGTRGTLRDQTERRELEQQLLQAQKLEGIGTLAGGIAHDFNNILGILIGHLDILRHPAMPKEVVAQSYIMMEKAIERGTGLVKQILTFARQADTLLGPVDINIMIKEFVRMVAETFPKTVPVRYDPCAAPSTIIADPTHIHQILLNICVNARDAMPRGGSVLIATHNVSGESLRKEFPTVESCEYIDLSIADTGTGMTPEVKQRIFDPFYTTKEKGKGTGLGLSTVYGLVQTHHGFISVDTTQGKGSTFHVYFPLPATIALTKPLEVVSAIQQTGRGETVLVIEDEETLSGLLAMTLTAGGYNVLVASDGDEGVRVFRENHHRIRMVMTDMDLPNLSGLQVFEHILAINPTVRLIFASGFVEQEVKSKMYSLGAKGFIGKPYRPSEVLTKIREVLDEPDSTLAE